MLRMNKDHRSVGLWWSLPLSGGSFGGHGSFLDLISPYFVFPIILPITVGVVADVFLEASTVTAGQWEEPPLSAIMMPGDLYLSLGKCPFFHLELRAKKRKERTSCGEVIFPLFLVCSSEGFPSLFGLGGPYIIAAEVSLGLSGPAWVLGLIDGPMPLILVLLLP